MLIRLTYLLALVLLAPQLQAQHPCYQQRSTDNGLPSNTVYDLELDHEGYLWLATELGTYRYDGYQFESYRHPAEKSRGTTGLGLAPDGTMFWINFRWLVLPPQWHQLPGTARHVARPQSNQQPLLR